MESSGDMVTKKAMAKARRFVSGKDYDASPFVRLEKTSVLLTSIPRAGFATVCFDKTRKMTATFRFFGVGELLATYGPK